MKTGRTSALLGSSAVCCYPVRASAISAKCTKLSPLTVMAAVAFLFMLLEGNCMSVVTPSRDGTFHNYEEFRKAGTTKNPPARFGRGSRFSACNTQSRVSLKGVELLTESTPY